MSLLQLSVYRLVVELACLAGVIVAGILAYADKSPWVWSWFLLFAFANMVTGGGRAVSTETKTETKDASPASTTGYAIKV